MMETPFDNMKIEYMYSQAMLDAAVEEQENEIRALKEYIILLEATVNSYASSLARLEEK